MSFTNINDPAGVSALLEQLRSSQAWADLQAQQSQPNTDSVQPAPKSSFQDELDSVAAYEDRPTPETGRAAPSVASLLSQLSATTSLLSSSSSLVPSPYVTPAVTSGISQPTPPSTLRRDHDVRNLTYQQSLTHLARLSDDQTFINATSQLRIDQENLEKQLWQERKDLQEKQADKVKAAVTRANMLGTSISQREAEAMKLNFERELQKFDKERVLPAWEGLIIRQQSALETLGVPTMFVTNSTTDRERQKRVISVLEGITGTDADS